MKYFASFMKLRKKPILCCILPKTPIAVIKVPYFSEGKTHLHSSNTKLLASTQSLKILSNKLNLFENYKKKHWLKICAVLLYENIVDNLDYNYFYKEFSMEDTLFSWFLITEIHVWMLMIRIMQEENDGLKLRNFIVEIMWNDVKTRTKKLGEISTAVRNSQLKLLSQQFNAAIIAYDAGITSDDMFLADQIWKRFFQSTFADPIQLEKFLYYIRKQVYILNKTATSKLISLTPDFKWTHS